MTLTRRTFLAASTAVCIGCGSGIDDDAGPAPTVGPTTTTGPEDTPDIAAPTFPPSRLGTVDEILAGIEDNDGFLYAPEARAWIVAYPAEALDAAAEHYDEATLAAMKAGFIVLYQKCPHLGCRVPECTSSGRFECPCHGARFNSVGEHVDGPSLRGLDRLPVTIVDGVVSVDLSAAPIAGIPAGTSTVDSDATGPSCLGLD